MFASLKNKIKEETGNDPTRVTSSGFKERPVVGLVGLDSDFKDRPRPSPSPSHDLLSDGHIEDCTNKWLKVGVGVQNSDLRKVEIHNSVQDINTSNLENEKTKYDESIDMLSKNEDLLVKESMRLEGVGQLVENLGDCVMLEAELDGEEKCSVKNSVIEVVPQVTFLVEDFRMREAARIKQVTAAEMKVRHMDQQLKEARYEISECNNKCSRLTQALTGEKNANALLTQEVSCLRNELLEQTSQVGKLSARLEKEIREKDVMLLRNAQLNQDIEVAKQNLRSQEQESLDLQSRLTSLENTLLITEKALRSQKADNEDLARRIVEMDSITSNQNAASVLENELRKNVNTLEEQLAEKVKSIRVLQQHLSDLKKTLQRELKQNGEESINAEGGAAMQYTPAPGEPDVNFKYLKHVIMKFLTSREYEAQHLTRAVSTLLRFSPEEERLLRETLDWKMSWFGTRPQLGFGQTSKTIPPS